MFWDHPELFWLHCGKHISTVLLHSYLDSLPLSVLSTFLFEAFTSVLTLLAFVLWRLCRTWDVDFAASLWVKIWSQDMGLSGHPDCLLLPPAPPWLEDRGTCTTGAWGHLHWATHSVSFTTNTSSANQPVWGLLHCWAGEDRFWKLLVWPALGTAGPLTSLCCSHLLSLAPAFLRP